MVLVQGCAKLIPNNGKKIYHKVSYQASFDNSPVNRAEIVLRLHGNIQPGVTQNCSSCEAKIFARAETIKS